MAPWGLRFSAIDHRKSEIHVMQTAWRGRSAALAHSF
jgi:hypothetical protein